MFSIRRTGVVLVFSMTAIALSSCSTMPSGGQQYSYNNGSYGYASFKSEEEYASRIPDHIASSEKTVVVDPAVHVWGAYEHGELVKAGIATAGGTSCPDEGGVCRTGVGTFHVHSLGEFSCRSKKYPKPHGGGLMPYCMYFNNGQALHGSPDLTVVEDNVSHGCVRMRIPDAEWLRYHFVSMGTKVVVKPY